MKLMYRIKDHTCICMQLDKVLVFLQIGRTLHCEFYEIRQTDTHICPYVNIRFLDL